MFNAINILEHIQNFLYQVDAVIVPNLGTFTAHYVPSKIDDEQKKILPPAKIVRYNPHLKISDGQLASYISKAESIPVAQAERLIASYVASLNDQLNSGNIVKLDQIGNLYKDSLGGIQHVFPENGNFSLETYGLPVVNLQNTNITDNNPPQPATIPSSWSSPIPSNTPEPQPEKQTIASILAENAKKNTPEPAEHTQATIPPPKNITNLQPISQKEEIEETQETEKSGGSSLWGCLLPLLISGLLIMLLMQILDPEHNFLNKIKGVKNNAELTIDQTNTTITSTTNIPNPDDTTLNNPTTQPNSIPPATADTRPTESPESIAANPNKPTDQPQEPPTNNTQQQKQPAKQTTTNTQTEEPIPVATNVAKETQTTTKTTKPTTTKTTTATTSTTKTKPKQQTATANEYLTLDGKPAPKGYYIVVGAFGDKNNAEQTINKLKASNLNTPYILASTKQNGLMRTAIYVAGGQPELANLYPEVQKTYPQAWILYIK